MSHREQLDNMIDCLAEPEIILLLEIVRRFIPDDIATADDLEAIEQAEAEYAAGEMVPESAINWD